MSFFGFRPYVPVAERQRQAKKRLAALRAQGRRVEPIEIEGRAIARSFWGSSWCENLERYSDYASRLPRGRSYVRNGLVIDLKIARSEVTASVSGSELYEVRITIAPVAAAHWQSICRDCAGTIDSLIELLQGRLAKGVMDRVCRKGDGLFPAPGEIKLSCSCPDWADMCKHVAAVLYGVGARLDQNPQLLFVLRGVDESELLARAGEDLSLTKAEPTRAKVLDDSDVAALFGLEMAEADGAAPAARPASERTGAGTAVGERGTKVGRKGKTATAAGRKRRADHGQEAPARKTAGQASLRVKPHALVPAVATVGTTTAAKKASTARTKEPETKKPETKKPTAKHRHRDGRSRPEPKWATLSRARKHRTARVVPRVDRRGPRDPVAG